MRVITFINLVLLPILLMLKSKNSTVHENILLHNASTIKILPMSGPNIDLCWVRLVHPIQCPDF